MIPALTDAEQAFRALLRDPKAYAVWAKECRKRWAERQTKSTPLGLR